MPRDGGGCAAHRFTVMHCGGRVLGSVPPCAALFLVSLTRKSPSFWDFPRSRTNTSEFGKGRGGGWTGKAAEGRGGRHGFRSYFLARHRKRGGTGRHTREKHCGSRVFCATHGRHTLRQLEAFQARFPWVLPIAPKKPAARLSGHGLPSRNSRALGVAGLGVSSCRRGISPTGRGAYPPPAARSGSDWWTRRCGAA